MTLPLPPTQSLCIPSLLELLSAGPGLAISALAADALAALAAAAPESLAVEAAMRAAFAEGRDGQPPRATRAALARLTQMLSEIGATD